MDDDVSDILGSSALRTAPSGSWASLSLFAKLSLVLGVSLFACLAGLSALDRFKRWQEHSYRKAMRRRHGIPDTDHRPFTVAYAAARARQERESKAAAATAAAPGRNPKQHRNALAEVRQRLNNNDSGVAGHEDAAVASNAHASTSQPWSSNSAVRMNVNKDRSTHIVPADPLNFAERYNPNPPVVRVTKPSPQPQSYPPLPPSPRRSSRKTLNLKRSLDVDPNTDDYAKKSRVEGEELIDGDEDAVWSQAATDGSINGKRVSANGRPKRGSKRVVNEEGDEDVRTNERDKRARKVSREHTPEDEEMEDIDEVMELDEVPRPSARGKKRDRAEAGSTFGGDGEDGEGSDERSKSKDSRRQKRRTRKSDVAGSRGKKRERDGDLEEVGNEEGESEGKGRVRRKKHEKKVTPPHEEEEEEITEGDISMDDAQVSHDPLCKGRRIGEEWEVNGVQYKVGPNGQRLRQAFIKKARSKFNMPKDSHHPDRQANLEVFVETWLTDEQYTSAKDGHELAWQDSPKGPIATSTSAPALIEPGTPGDVHDSPSKGKNLLWSSTTSTSAGHPTPGSPRRFRQSIATNLGLRINPFNVPAAPGRRVASAYSGAGGADSPGKKAGGFRSFSKWEKQDLEAEAMAKMRMKVMEQKKKEVETKLPPAAATIGFGTPIENKPSETKAPVTVSFTAPPPVATTTTSSDASKPAAPPLFSLPPKPPTSAAPTDAPKPATSTTFSWPASNATSVPVPTPQVKAAPTPTPRGPSFSFAPPPNQQQQQPAAPPVSSSSVPSFLGVNTAPPAHAAPTPFNSGSPAQPQVPSKAETVPQKPSFSFASNPSSSTTGSSSAPSAFNFGQPPKAPSTTTSIFGGGEQNKPEQKNTEQPAANTTGANGAGSLLGRLGGFAAPQPQTQPAATPTNGSGFVFGKSNAPEVPKPAAVASPSTVAPAQAAPASTSSSVPASGTNAPLKFNFGFGSSKPSSPAPAAPTGNAGEAPKPTANGFTPFGTPNSATATGTVAPTGNAPAPSKFGFNAPSGSGSAFDSTSTFRGGSDTAASSSVPSNTPKSTFGAFGGGTNNAFSTTPAGPPSVFGASGGAAKPSTFSFGNSDSSSKPADAPKSAFGSATAAAPEASTGNKSTGFTFNFGQSGTNNSTTPSVFGSGAVNSGSAPAFGKPSNPTPSAFGFGTGTASPSSTGTGGGAFTFGGQNQQQK